MEIISKFINKLQTSHYPNKSKKVYPLICIQGSTTFEFYCYVLSASGKINNQKG